MARNAQAGISFYDVARACRDIGRSHNGRIGYQLTLPVREGARVAFNVRCYIVRGSGGSNTGYFERGYAGSFPTPNATTLSGELLRIVYKLEQELDEEESALARQPNRLPGF